MQQAKHRAPTTNPGSGRFWLVLLAFGGVALFMLWGEHRVHILGALPYLILLLCPLLHLFMHRGHGGHGHPGRRGDEP